MQSGPPEGKALENSRRPEAGARRDGPETGEGGGSGPGGRRRGERRKPHDKGGRHRKQRTASGEGAEGDHRNPEARQRRR